MKSKYSDCLKRVPLLLVGTKLDLLKSRLIEGKSPLTQVRKEAYEWLNSQNTHRFGKYYECSAVNKINVESVFDWATRKALVMRADLELFYEG